MSVKRGWEQAMHTGFEKIWEDHGKLTIEPLESLD